MKRRGLATAVLLGLAGLWVMLHVTQPERASRGHGVPAQNLAGFGRWAGGQSPTLGSTTLTHVPLAFVENRGQWDVEARFVARARDLTAYLEPGAIVLRQESRGVDRGHIVRMEFEGCSPEAGLRGEQPLPGEHHFLRGNNRSRWRRHVPGHASVLYRGLYEGLDVRVRERRQQRHCLEYDLLLAPGANLSEFVVRCEGSGPLRITEQGALELPTPVGPLLLTRPVAWAVLPSGERQPLACHYRLLGAQRFGFGIEGHDKALSVVIDPGLEWSTFFGGGLNEVLNDLTVDASGAVTFVGDTKSLDLPVSAGAFDTIFGPHLADGPATFVSRLDASEQLVFSTYLEGSSSEVPHAVAVAANGDTLVGGSTFSPDFPVTPGAFDTVKDGAGDAFITRLTADGSDLVFSTFLGGAGFGIEDVRELALTAGGDVIAVLRVDPADFPTTPGAYDTTHNSPGGPDVAVACLDATGSTLLFSTFLGGSSTDYPRGMALGPKGEVLVVGGSSSLDFPTTPGAFSVDFPGAFVTCLTADGSALVFSTAFGGSNNGDVARAAAFGPMGNIYVAGETHSNDFPTTPDAFQPTATGGFGPEGFLSCFDPTGTHLIYSTYLGGVRSDVVQAVMVDSAGSALLAGGTQSLNFPVTEGAFDTLLNDTGIDGTYDVFVSMLSPDGSRLDYSTYLGGNMADALAFGGRVGMGRLDDGSVIVGTTTFGAGYPTTPAAFQEGFAGTIDLALSRLDLLPTGVTRYGASTPGCQGPLVIGITAMPKAGAVAFLTCREAPPFSAAGLLLVSLGQLTTPVDVNGAQMWVDPAGLVNLLPVSSNPLGYAEFRVRVPDRPGAQASLQFFWPDACASGGWSASSALAIEIQ